MCTGMKVWEDPASGSDSATAGCMNLDKVRPLSLVFSYNVDEEYKCSSHRDVIMNK